MLNKNQWHAQSLTYDIYKSYKYSAIKTEHKEKGKENRNNPSIKSKPNQKYIVHFKEEKKRNIYMGFFNPIKNVIKGKN